ncbi:MAG: YbjQ family protein [Patescibacteria group bacterium]
MSTTYDIPGQEIVEIKGIARGSTVRARMVVFDIFSAFRNIIGGELNEYTKLQADAREQALERLEADAKKMGADAIIGLRFESATIAAGASELYAYGTAVTFKK